MHLDRRETLAFLGSTAALGALRAARLAPRRREGPDAAELAERFRRCARDQALDEAARAIRAGADLETFLAAVFLAGIQDVRPRHVGGKLHAVMMVESAFQLSERTDRLGAWLLALWNLDDFKGSQEADREEGDWVLPERPEVSGLSPERARSEFLAAMEAWDDERADRALVALLPHCAPGAAFELLWPLAARSFVNIGHKIIYAAQIERVLRRIGARHAEPALRSLVYGLLYQPGGRELEAFERSHALAPRLPDGWLAGHEDPALSRELLAKLRACDSSQAQELVVAAFGEGLGPATIWDGLRCYASELFLRRTKSRPAHDRAALLPVHTVTVVNACGHAWRSAASGETKRLLVLQAAGWLPQLRDAIGQIVGLATEGVSLDALGDPGGSERGGLDELLADPTPRALCARLQQEPSECDALRGRLAGFLARKGSEHHQHKYAAAVFEESSLVHPRWSAHLLACAVPYLPAQSESETELCQRSLRALRKAGIG